MGERVSQDAVDMSLKLALSTPLADILAYRKLGKAYFSLLDVLCHHHPNIIATCDTATFSFLVRVRLAAAT
jgi:exportin-7